MSITFNLLLITKSSIIALQSSQLSMDEKIDIPPFELPTDAQDDSDHNKSADSAISSSSVVSSISDPLADEVEKVRLNWHCHLYTYIPIAMM